MCHISLNRSSLPLFIFRRIKYCSKPGGLALAAQKAYQNETFPTFSESKSEYFDFMCGFSNIIQKNKERCFSLFEVLSCIIELESGKRFQAKIKWFVKTFTDK